MHVEPSVPLQPALAFRFLAKYTPVGSHDVPSMWVVGHQIMV